MNPNGKKSKLPIVLLLTAAIVVSLVGGVSFGRYISSDESMFNDEFYISEVFDKIFPNRNQTSTTDTPGDSIIEIVPVPDNIDGGYEATDIYDKVNKSVVNINVYSSASISPMGSGTGIVLSEDGYIITNAHVVKGGNSVNVIFDDSTQARGTIVGLDEDTDLAVVKVEKAGLVPAEFGDSTALKVGERIVAIGNAGGLSSTMTQGIISGLDRDLNQGGRSLSLIQVDAAINPGNSGGPLINRYGQVVGINSSKIADVDFEGIGFSIPVTEALPIIDSIVQFGYVKGRAVLGVSVVALNSSNGPINGLPDKGIYIAEIQPDSDLASQGVRVRDVILKANDKDTITSNDLLDELEKFSPGDKINLTIYRPETKETFTASVTLLEQQQQ